MYEIGLKGIGLVFTFNLYQVSDITYKINAFMILTMFPYICYMLIVEPFSSGFRNAAY